MPIEFNNESITGNVTLSGNDGWRGEWIRLISNGTIQKECPIVTFIDGNRLDYSNSTNFVCPGGMSILKQYLILFLNGCLRVN